MRAPSWSRAPMKRCWRRRDCTRACGHTRAAAFSATMPIPPWRNTRGARERHTRGASALERPTAPGKNSAQVTDGRKNLVVPVGALRIVGALLVFHDFLVLAEYVLSEPGHERPGRMDETRDRWLFN